MFFDGHLNLLKQFDLKGTGHAPLIGDFDDDGYDEFVIGYNMIDHDLKYLWTMDYWFGRKIDHTGNMSITLPHWAKERTGFSA